MPGSPSAGIWVGLGSNMDTPDAQLRAALDELNALDRTRCLRHSRLYRSAPVGGVAQPDFCNAVAELATSLAPQALLEQLLDLEQAHGRERGVRWGPRRLDLDVLLYADRVIDSATLTCPHPRMHERAFVLRPLADLAPDLEIPGRGTVADLLAGLPDADAQWVRPWAA